MFKKGNENWTTHYLFWSFHDTTNNKQPTKNTKYDIQATTKGIYEIEAKWHLSIFVKLKTYHIVIYGKHHTRRLTQGGLPFPHCNNITLPVARTDILPTTLVSDWLISKKNSPLKLLSQMN